MAGKSRINREVKSGICERLGVKLPGRLGPMVRSQRPTHDHKPNSRDANCNAYP